MPPNHSDYLAIRNFKSLDGLRCLSILAVVAHHCHCFKYGFLGVNLFFTISGFLITTLLLRERARHGNISLKLFYMRRSLRIFPLYYAVVLVYTVVVFLFESGTAAGRSFWKDLPYYLTYTSNWFVRYEDGQRVIFYFAWSLAAEEQFYAAWPSVEKFFKEKALWGILTVVFIASQLAVLVCLAMERGPAGGAPLWVMILKRIPIEILAGVALAHLLHAPRSFGVCAKVFGSRAMSLFALLLLTGAIFFVPGMPLLRNWALALCMTALVGSCVVREDHFFAKFLSWKAVKHIGVISYGVYLFHMLCKNFSDRALDLFGASHSNLVVFLATLFISVVVATLSYRFYESRFLNLKAGYSR